MSSRLQRDEALEKEDRIDEMKKKKKKKNTGLFETSICAIAIFVIAALSAPEHCLSFYFVCDDQIQISCAV